MAWDGIFKLAATEGKRELNLRRESLPAEDARAIERWSDLTLFKVRGLNHLLLTGFSLMTELHPRLAQLNYLLELIVAGNGLESLPEELGQLSRLRLLDASHNQLSRLPLSLYQLSTLHILLLGHNCLTGGSFPEFPGGAGVFPELQRASLVSNWLEALPEFVYESPSLSELEASNNKLSVLAPDIEKLSGLRQLHLDGNLLTELPPQLGRCAKLKVMRFDDNPLADRRLAKIIAQHAATKPKAVLDYLAAKAPGKGADGKRAKKAKGRKQKESQSPRRLHSDEEEDDDDMVVEFSSAKPTIRIVRPDRYLEVQVTEGARRLRPYLVCAVARDLCLDSEEAMAKFIGIQTRLHHTVCKRRRLATIATHDLSALSFPLSYGAAAARKISLQPLGWFKVVTADKFLRHLDDNKLDPSVGGKKVTDVDAAAAQLSKFLPMVDASQMVFLRDSSGAVVSLPPLTNSELSKLEEHSRHVLLEVTSSTSLADAKKAMDSLILAMLEADFASSQSEAAAPSAQPVLAIEQVRVKNEEDKVLVLYPSRADLAVDGDRIEVVRPNYT